MHTCLLIKERKKERKTKGTKIPTKEVEDDAENEADSTDDGSGNVVAVVHHPTFWHRDRCGVEGRREHGPDRFVQDIHGRQVVGSGASCVIEGICLGVRAVVVVIPPE